jgi:CheY-like chemotaxis protein
MKIIVADDEKDLGILIKMTLEKDGHQIILDPSASFLDRLKDDLPDLILLDINLRNQDGGTLCERLKQDSHTKNIPIILISGIQDLKQISQLCGAQDYLIKPFEISELKEVVARYSKKPVSNLSFKV